MKCFVEELVWSPFCILDFVMRKYDFRGGWSENPQNRKTKRQTVLKSRGSTLTMGSYIQTGSAPPPPGDLPRTRAVI